MKDPNHIHDMQLQGILAIKVYKKIHPEEENVSRSIALREWAAGQDHHCLSDFYREVLEREHKDPIQIPLSDENELEHIVEEIVSMKEADTIH